MNVLNKLNKYKSVWSGISIFVVCFCCGFVAEVHRNSIVNSVNVSQEIMVNVAVENVSPKVAIVIDDFGYNGEGSYDMLNLPIPITSAIMPFSSHSKETGELAKQLGQEVIVHMPMESKTGKREWVGDKGIFLDMSDEEIVNTTIEAFEILPMAVGVNNHMGSAIMEDERSLSAVMSVVSNRNNIFLDSVTTGESLGESVALGYGVNFIKRDVFLDSTDDIDVVYENMMKAMEIAKSKGQAVAIGHVGVEGGNITVQAIKNSIEVYKENGVEFVFLSELY